DRNIDAKMERTKKRALVTGKVSPRNSLIFAFSLLAVGLLFLLNTNALTLSIGIFAIYSYVVLYGIAKRKSVHGTLIGTIPGAASLVAGYVCATNNLDLGAFLLFLIMVSWQMPHFYAIAMYRFRDYKQAKIPVLPVVKGMKRTKLEILFYTFLFTISVT